MLSFLLLLICLSSTQATACSSCTVSSITGILNDLQLRAHISAVASTLNPPCTVDFVDATILVNRVALDLVLHYPRALTAAEKIAHQIALKAAVIVKLSVLGTIDAAISLDVFVGVSSTYRCSIHILAAPTLVNILEKRAKVGPVTVPTPPIIGVPLVPSIPLVPSVPLVPAAIAPEPQSSNRICNACNNVNSASTFGILASTFTNTGLGTSIDGDLGYTTPPAQNPTVSGMVVTPTQPTGLYASAGRDQAALLATLNGLPCMYNFSGATDLSTVNGGNLVSGIYCIAASASVGTAGIRFMDAGALYVFRIRGVLTTVTGSPMSIATLTSACNIFWTPQASTTLAANSAFAGTLFGSAGVTTGAHVEYTGRILAFGGTVTTDQTTITVPCFA